MTTRRSFVFVIAVLTGLAGCATRPVSRDWMETGELETASFYRFWETTLPLGAGDAAERCYLVDDNLYVMTEHGNMYAIHADQGLLRWGANLTEPDYTIYRPSHLQSADGHGPVAVVTTQDLKMLDRYSGETIYSAPLPFPPGGGPVGDRRRVWMGSSDGHMYSLLWRHHLGDVLRNRWRVKMNSPITATPVLIGQDALVFATQGGAVVSCDPLDKARHWWFRTDDAIVADPFVDTSGVYVASTDRSLYKLDLYSGLVRWRHRLPAPLTDGPVVSRYTCYQYCPGNGLTAIDADTGEEKWRRADGLSFVAGGGPGEAVILTTADTMDVVDTDTGDTKRSFGTGGARITTSNAESDTVYLVHRDGHVACVRPEGVPYLRKQEVEAARAYLNRPTPARQDVATAPPAARREAPDPLRSPRDTGR